MAMIQRGIKAILVSALTLYVGISVIGAGSSMAAEIADLKPGDAAPNFKLMDTEGTAYQLDDMLNEGKTVILEWFNPDCPYVKRYHAGEQPNPSLSEAYAFAAEHGYVWLAINSAAPGKQGHGVERNDRAREEYGISYPVLLDESGKVGRAYGATSTPQLFIISSAGELLYVGGVDDTRTNKDQPRQKYLLDALVSHQAGDTIELNETPHPGCSVKYSD